ncbi:thiamine pyrophosphate-dependent enzyme [Dickeya zeae]|uniref:alpha-keto acid decarboxylase family protein n=1 Tax=Dickeya zeae TaxID=204042 RepID=UPI001CFBA9EC|nr:thiamine pyrophosphate-binding protein [Dickeya zeae]UCZ74428.1 thiamine pyrophosphate-dependent enzyme [Dickeya zeae]
MKEQLTVVEYVIERLAALGIEHIFGVAGDYAFPIEDAACKSDNLQWIGNCNELNASYAADGYARVKGMAALSTTFGVGELSAINGVAGAYTENLTVFHLVGMPASHVQQSSRLVHHTLGDGNFLLFYELGQRLACAHAILTPENCVDEMERLIHVAMKEHRPVYIGLPSDYAESALIFPDEERVITPDISDPASHDEAIAAIVGKLTESKSVCVLPGIITSRLGLTRDVKTLISTTGFPFATMFMDKSVIEESDPHYIGMYNGNLMNTDVKQFVENCDCVLMIGATLTDFNTGCFTSALERKKIISIDSHQVTVDDKTFHNIAMKDVLQALISILPHAEIATPKPGSLGKPVSNAEGKITPQYLYPRFEHFFRKNDIIFAETGTVSMGLGFALLPEGAQLHNQTLWGSIGWATPAAFGAGMALPDRRTLLITGEGAHQLTAQEISQFGRFGLKPIIFVINNDGYLIERLLCKDPEAIYNDLPQWSYAQLPKVLGCNDWFCRKVSTCDELDEAMREAESCNQASYIEIVMERYAASELAEKLGASVATLYS